MIGYFLLLTFTISYSIIALYGYSDLIMLIPGAFGILFSLSNPKKILSTVKVKSFKSIGTALLGTFFVFCLLIIATTIFCLAEFSLPLGLLEASDNNTIQALMRLLFFVLPTGFMINLPFALGEELGWRGYLLNNINKKYSLLYKSLYVGFFWGLWHVPLYITFNASFISILLLMINVLCISIFYSYLFQQHHSIWPSTIAHALHNTLINYIFFLIFQPSISNQYILGEEGLLCILGYSIVIFYIIRKNKPI